MRSSPVAHDEPCPHLERDHRRERGEYGRDDGEGSVCTPAESVEYPLTNWKYWVIKKMNPKRQKKATDMERAPPLNAGVFEDPHVEQRALRAQLEQC